MGQRLGQHFLHATSILDKIAAAVCPEPEPLVLEIGPGKGALTHRLLPLTRRLVAIELDQELASGLESWNTGGVLEVVRGDVLDCDLARWGPAVVAGNLPYYITSPILEKLRAMGPALKRAVILIQKEVADRLMAAPGSRDYGYLSVRTQVAFDLKRVCLVERTAFRPPPDVRSAVVLLEPRAKPVSLPGGTEAFLSFAGVCFQQKRKNLRNNLAGLFGKEKASAIPEAGRRAEELTIEELVDLYGRLVG